MGLTSAEIPFNFAVVRNIFYMDSNVKSFFISIMSLFN